MSLLERVATLNCADGAQVIVTHAGHAFAVTCTGCGHVYGNHHGDDRRLTLIDAQCAAVDVANRHAADCRATPAGGIR